MIDIARQASGKEHIIFVVDEVGQYVASRQSLILNLDGLAKNLKGLGGGKVWIMGTAQQTLAADDPRAALNSPELYKLSARFPIQIDLEASDIREICYERLLGNEHDAVILLTDYQEQKKKPPLRIQVINQAYLKGSQIADSGLCKVAKRCRDRLLASNPSELKKIMRFLAFVNQSDRETKMLLGLLSSDFDDTSLKAAVKRAVVEFDKSNASRDKKGQELFPLECRERVSDILQVTPHWQGLINAVDNWVIETQKDAGRFPNDSEWNRFTVSPLDGRIGMSLALQWRYNFGPLFCMKSGRGDE